MGRKSWLLLMAGAFIAYYIYTPVPENFEEPWKLMCLNVPVKMTLHLATFVEFLGFGHMFEIIKSTSNIEKTSPTSDENVTVTQTKFDNIPVFVYVPKRKSEALRRAVFYIHGGGWCLADAAFANYDLMSRQTAERLDAVVVSTNYRLGPKYHFPVQFEDVYSALKWFLREDILKEYGVNPKRIGVSGDSAGGNLAAAVALQLSHDMDVKIKLKVQALIYPALQTLKFDSPSYQENSHMPLLSRSLMVRFWSEYFTTDRSLETAMLSERHVPMQWGHLYQLVNWSSLLPERFVKGHIYKNPTYGSARWTKKYPGFLDLRAAPLLAEDDKLRGLPRTYILTCQHDVLRDDGLMYVTRLRNVGVPVTLNHVEDGIHGAISFLKLKISYRLMNEYISWLKGNL